MIAIAVSIFALLVAIGMVLLGIGLQGTLVGLRAVQETFPISSISFIMSAYFIGFSVGSYFCPPVIRRVGHIRAFTALAAIASAAAVIYVLLIDPVVWIVLRIITGICMVGIYMVIESWLNTLAPNQVRGQFLSIYMTVNLLALTASQYLLQLGDIGDFTLFAITTVLISIAVVPIALTRIDQPSLIEVPKLQLTVIYHQSPMGVVGAFIAGVIQGAFWGMGAVYGLLIGLDKTDVAWLISLTILGGATLQWIIGKVSDLFDRRRVLSLSAVITTMLALSGYMYGHGPSVTFYMIYFFFGGFAFTFYSLSVAHVNDQLQPEQALDASQGLLQIYGVGAIFGPLIAGALMDYHGPNGLPLVYAAASLALVLFAVYRMFVHAAPSATTREPFIPIVRTSTVSIDMDPRTDAESESDTEVEK